MDLALPPGGILLGLGCDVIEVARVQGVVERQGARFLDRVFTPEELAYCLRGQGSAGAGIGKLPGLMASSYKHLAARFAAKEAVSKCFTTGIGAELGWKSVSVYHGARHEPLVRLDERGRALLRRCGGTQILLTLSHTETVAMAVAALVRAS